MFHFLTGFLVKLTRSRPLATDTPCKVYGWFDRCHRLSHGLVFFGYLAGVLDFNGLNPA